MAISLSEIAAAVHCSVSTVSHLFRERSGAGVSAYIEKLRMQEAAALLRGSDMTVTAIALAVGFEDPNYFSAVFRRRFGMSPQKYRKESLFFL